MRFWLDTGRRWAAAGRHPLSDRARGHQLREPARDPRRDQEDPGGDRRQVSRPHAAGRSQSMAGGRLCLFRPGRRMPHVLPLPADAAHLHGDRAGGPAPDHRHHAPDAGDPRQLPVGHLPAQSRRADARDGDRPGARLSLELLRRRPADADQSRHPPAARAAAEQRPAEDRAAQQPAAVHARHAGAVLRRRDRHGRQRLSRRPRWRADADAMVVGSQRRVLHLRSAAALPAADHGPDLRLQHGQRRGAGPLALQPAQLDEAPDRRLQAAQLVRARHAEVPLPRQPQSACLSPRARRRVAALHREPVARGAGGGTGSLALQGARAGGTAGPFALPADRRPALSADPARLRLLLVRPAGVCGCAALARRAAGADAGIHHPGDARRLEQPDQRARGARALDLGAAGLHCQAALVRRQGRPHRARRHHRARHARRAVSSATICC